MVCNGRIIYLFYNISASLNLDWQFTISNFIQHITFDPIQYQFWFLRDLLFLAALSPIIYWSVKRCLFFIIIPLMLLWVYTGEATFIVRSESLLFFSCGAVIALSKLDIGKLRVSITKLLVLFTLWVTLSVVIGLMLFHSVETPFLLKSTMLSIVKTLGILVIWFGYDLYHERLETAISPDILSSTFFIFCFHEPLLTIFKKYQ